MAKSNESQQKMLSDTWKVPLGVSVLQAARERISKVFDDFPRICVSFSGGKDSTVMTHLVCDEARRRGRRVGLLFVDLEAQYKLTIDHVERMFAEYADCIEPFWVSLPISLRNAVSNYDPQWTCWDPSKQSDWVRQPSALSITDCKRWGFFRAGMEFEEFVPKFAEWFADGKLCASFVGIRTAESLNRWRSLVKKKANFEGLKWTTWSGKTIVNCYPVFDWKTADLWTYHAKFGGDYNRLYDRMHQAGLTPHQMRICQPYGDDQRKGLWLFHIIEPETWSRVVARVNGANSGALYARETGNINGVCKVTKPAGHTWESFAKMLLASMPDKSAEHFRDKIAVFLNWYQDRGFPTGIPDEGDAGDRKKPSWTRICKVLLRNDYWCKGLSFTQHKSESYERYKKLMKKRRDKWNLI